VNEADIGRIHLGMPVTFQVEAFPDENFHGTVEQIRLNAQSLQNVVIYTVVVTADNSNLKLLPYLTTDPVKFEVERHNDILLVPNAALRWQPRPEQIVPELRDSAKSGPSEGDAQSEKDAPPSTAEKSDNSVGKAAPGAEKGTAKGEGKPRRSRSHDERATLWVKDGNFVRPIDVRKGSNDDTDTEVKGDNLQEGMEVVVGEIRATADTAEENNPFAPRFFRGNRPGAPGGQKGAPKGAK
jgi:HlyD family secretion protein